MRNASPEPEPIRQGITCASCGRFSVHAVLGVFANPQVGSPRRFCSPACRQAAHRRRRAAVPENTARQHDGGRSRHLSPPEQPTDQQPS